MHRNVLLVGHNSLDGLKDYTNQENPEYKMNQCKWERKSARSAHDRHSLIGS